jgi:RHS repeat-associated protein
MKNLLKVLFLYPLAFFFSLHSLEEIKDLQNPFLGSNLHRSLQIITGDWVEAEVDIETKAPERMQLKRAFYPLPRQMGELARGWHFNVPDLGEACIPRVKFAPPQDHQFLYQYDDLKRLTRVELAPIKEKTPVNWFDITYQNGTCTVISNEGEKVSYGLSKNPIGGDRLDWVQKDNGYFCEYLYAPHPTERKLLLKERREKGEAWMKFTHWDSLGDSKNKKGKIKELYQSHDQGETYRFICSLDYDEQATYVVDALQVLTKYYHDGSEKIQKIETYTPDQLLYKIQEYEWQGELLVRRTVKDPEGQIVVQEKWAYDISGNLVEEVFEGTLTKIGEGLESYKKSYTYNAWGQLIQEREEGGAVYRYFYDSKGRQVSKLTCEGPRIAFRTFYTYDSEGRLSATYLDDGCVEDREDLTSVHQRTFEKTLEFSPQNYPLRQVKGYFDHEEITVEETLFSYDPKGKLLQKTIRNLLAGQEEWTAYSYGAEDKMTESSTSQGEITRFFEKEKRISSQDRESISLYSQEGDLILEETYKKGRLVDSRKYTHGPTGLILSSEDQGGNKTEFNYDCFSRLKEEILPPATFLEGLERPIKGYSYNTLDQVAVQTDPMGCRVRMTYNARGKPLLIEFPDGSIEEKHYFKNGLLKKEIFRNGTSIEYGYDFAGRVIQKGTYDTAHHLAEKVCYTYQGFNLSQETRSSGMEISHTYDALGRVVESTALPKGRKVVYEYGASGELSSQKEWISHDEFIEVPLPLKAEPLQEGDDVITDYILNSFGQFVLEEQARLPNGLTRTVTYDPLKRMEKIETFSPEGTLLDRHHFRYDLNGRKTQERIEVLPKGGVVIHAWSYDPLGNVIQTVEDAGTSEEKTTTHLYNSSGQLLKDILSDSREIYYFYDPLGRLEKLSSSDSSVAYSLAYDSEGRVFKIIDEVHGLITWREYTSEGQLAKEILGNGLAIQNRYDLLGRRTKLTLPDASSIHYCYSAADCSSIRREDAQGMEVYSYHYLELDSQGRPLKTAMIGGLGEMNFKRLSNGRCMGASSPYFSGSASLDQDGRIISLKTQDPLGCYERSFSYDDLSQLTSESSEHGVRTYQFDNLNNPQNFSSSNEYDLNGNLIKNGSFTFAYDALNRLTKVEKEGRLIHSYIYDLFHRRIADQCSSRRFLYDGNWEMGCYSEGNAPLELRIFETPRHQDHGTCIAFELLGELFAPIYDLTGSVAALISVSSKQAAATYRYSAFGECRTEETGIKSPWGFANKRLEADSGLIFFGRRDYDPASGRFITQDPLGFHDGPGRLAFLHNNPLNAFDIFGLKSIPEQWNDSLQKGLQFFQSFFKTIGASIKSWFSRFFQKIKETAVNAMNCFLHHVIGTGFLLLFAHYDHGPKTGVYGKGEVSDKVRVSFMNGILTEHEYMMESLKALSESHGNVNIHFVHRQTKGCLGDILSGFLVQLGFISPDAHELAKEWKKMIQEMGGVKGGGKIIHYAHSIGAMETLRALSLLSPEEKMMIEIYTFGSPSLAIKDPDANVHHFASIRDGVCLIDIVSFFKAAFGKIKNVVFVGTLFGLPFVDHLFANQSYQDLWKSMGRTFVEWYGTV